MGNSKQDQMRDLQLRAIDRAAQAANKTREQYMLDAALREAWANDRTIEKRILDLESRVSYLEGLAGVDED